MVRLAVVLGLALAGACINQARQAIAPEPTGEGTLSCREIVEQCDTQCSDPLCVNRCSNEGTADGAAQHVALVDCGQRNACTDQACMEASCGAEIQTCMGETQEPAADAPAESAAPVEPAPVEPALGDAPAE